MATPMSELQANIAGYGKTSTHLEQKRKLLQEAGQSGLKFTFLNRGVDQPYKIVGTWLLGQWKKAGMKVDQVVKPTTPFYASLRKKGDFDVSVDFNCQSIVNLQQMFLSFFQVRATTTQTLKMPSSKIFTTRCSRLEPKLNKNHYYVSMRSEF